MANEKTLQDLQDEAESQKILDNIDQEVKNQDVGHTAYNKVKYARNFNTSLLENSLFAHDDELLDHDITQVDDTISTFDEANYTLGSEEYYEDNK